MSVAVKDLERFQNILDSQTGMTAQLEEKDARIAELEAEIKTQAEDTKDLEQFRPLLQSIPPEFYKIQLHDTPLMRQFLARVLPLYGPRFGKGIANMSKMEASDTKFTRQCLDSAVLACIRYCVGQNSRWNDMVAHHLS